MPYIAVSLCLGIAVLSYLQVSSSASVFITYLTGLVGSAQLVTWFGMSFTWIRWNAAYKAQGISRETLPVRVSSFSSSSTILAEPALSLRVSRRAILRLVCSRQRHRRHLAARLPRCAPLPSSGKASTHADPFSRCTVFLKGRWDVSTFIFSYAMPILFPIFFLFWKLVKRTKWETSLSADITSFVDDPEVCDGANNRSLEVEKLTALLTADTVYRDGALRGRRESRRSQRILAQALVDAILG